MDYFIIIKNIYEHFKNSDWFLKNFEKNLKICFDLIFTLIILLILKYENVKLKFMKPFKDITILPVQKLLLIFEIFEKAAKITFQNCGKFVNF